MINKSGSAVSNVRWVATSQVGRAAVQLASISVLARLLPASDFGLLAMATIVTNFADLIRDMGTSNALIQRNKLSDELLDTIFWSNILFGFVSGAVVALGSPLVALAFNESALQTVLILLSLAFPLACSGATHLALLARASRFRTIAIIEIVSALAGASVGVVAAWNGVGVISLVLQTLVTAALSTCLLWALSKWRPTLRWSKDEFQSLLHFSGNLVGFNFVNYFARNADAMLIGRFLGPVELALYNIAYRIMLFPLNNLTFVVDRALFPIYCRQQHDRVLMGNLYLKTVTLISVVTAPLMLGLWAVRESFVAIMLGQKWLGATAIIAWLAPTAYLQSLTSTTGSVLMATGRTKLLRNLGIICSTLYVLSFVLGLNYGAASIARAYFFANVITSAIYLHYTLIQVELALMDVVRSVIRPLISALVMAFVVFLANRWIVPANTSALVKLGCLVPLGAGVYFVLLLVLVPDALGQIRRLLIQRGS